jgi:cellulose synthase/poly-beta-1,6-N-acetylglucosamine synthase-like glycosyltransferase
MRLDRGGTVIFRPSAKAWETVPETVRDEFRRRVRIGAGDAHALRHTWRLLLPQYGMLAVSYWSHKIVRWLGPALLVIACVGNIWLLDRPWGRALFLVQLAVYSIGFAAPMLRRLPLISQMATGVWYFMVLNAALLLGTLKYLAGRATPVWQRTPRTGERIPHLRAYRSHTKPVVESPEQSQEDSPAA